MSTTSRDTPEAEPVSAGRGIPRGVAIGLIAAGVVLVLVIAGLVFDIIRNGGRVSDWIWQLAIVFLVIGQVAVTVIVGAVVYVLLRLVLFLKGQSEVFVPKVGPIMDDVKATTARVKDTAQTARGTAAFISDQVAKPIIRTTSFVSAVNKGMQALVDIKRNTGPASQAEAKARAAEAKRRRKESGENG